MDVETLYEQHSAPLLRFVRSRVNNGTEAEDICSQVWLEAVRQTFDDTTPHAWLYTVARSRIVDRVRQRARRQIITLEEHHVSTDGGLTHVENSDALIPLFSMLTPKQRQIVEMYDRQAMPLTEIATQLHYSYGAVKALHKRAIDTMRREAHRAA